MINTNIELIESNKELLKEYINVFLDRIEILYNNSKFTVIRITVENKSEKILIDKRDNHRVKTFIISDCVTFNNDTFTFNNIGYSIEEITKIKTSFNNFSTNGITTIEMFIRSHQFRKLNVY